MDMCQILMIKIPLKMTKFSNYLIRVILYLLSQNKHQINFDNLRSDSLKIIQFNNVLNYVNKTKYFKKYYISDFVFRLSYSHLL